MSEKHYFQKEKEEILNRIFKVMREKDLSNADVARRLNYSTSKVSKVLSGNQELSINFMFSFARAYCKCDYCYLLSGVRKSTLTALVDFFKDVSFDKQEKLLADLLAIANMFKTF